MKKILIMIIMTCVCLKDANAISLDQEQRMIKAFKPIVNQLKGLCWDIPQYQLTYAEKEMCKGCKKAMLNPNSVYAIQDCIDITRKMYG